MTANDKVTIVTACAIDAEALERSGSRRDQNATDLRVPAIPLVSSPKVTEVNSGVIEANLATAIGALRRAFSSTFKEDFGEFQLNEVEVALEVTADGRVGFMGSGMGIKGSSTFKLKFGRKSNGLD